MQLESVISWLLFVTLALASTASAMENERRFKLTCLDGFKLDGKVRLPMGEDSTSDPKVIILNHGSGANSMDQDLTAVTRGGRTNLFFRDIAEALSAVGFTVIRYHKRSYQVGLEVKSEPSFKDSDLYKQYAANPLKAYVDDCIACIRYAEQQYPRADIFLLGHSVGTYVALQAAHQVKSVKGVALIGFYATSSDFLLLEQTVYRPLHRFAALDKDRNGLLNQEELSVQTPLAAALLGQMPVLDSDADNKISRVEYQATNLANLLVSDLLPRIDLLRAQESRYPRVADILKDASFKVVFFQGMLDNQTLAYNAKSIELAAKNVWKKTNFRFYYFPNLGHALDRRSNFGDLTYSLIDPEARQKLAVELSEFF